MYLCGGAQKNQGGKKMLWEAPIRTGEEEDEDLEEIVLNDKVHTGAGTILEVIIDLIADTLSES